MDEQEQKRTCRNSFLFLTTLKRGCYFISNIQMVISVVLFFGTIVIVWNEKEIKETESSNRGIFILTTLAVVSILFYIADFMMHLMFVCALKKERLHQIKICLVYSFIAPVIEVSRVIVCLDFSFLLESTLFIICFVLRIYWVFIIYNYRKQVIGDHLRSISNQASSGVSVSSSKAGKP